MKVVEPENTWCRVNAPAQKRPWWWMTICLGDELSVTTKIVIPGRNGCGEVSHKNTFICKVKAIRKIHVNDAGSIFWREDQGFDRLPGRFVASQEKMMRDLFVTDDNEFVYLDNIVRVCVRR